MMWSSLGCNNVLCQHNSISWLSNHLSKGSECSLSWLQVNVWNVMFETSNFFNHGEKGSEIWAEIAVLWNCRFTTLSVLSWNLQAQLYILTWRLQASKGYELPPWHYTLQAAIDVLCNVLAAACHCSSVVLWLMFQKDDLALTAFICALPTADAVPWV